MSISLPDLSLLSYTDFVGKHLTLKMVNNLNAFEYAAQTSLAGSWGMINPDRVAIRIQASILEALRLAGFHNPTFLNITLESRGIRFEYLDTEYGFDWIIEADGRIRLTRTGSSMRRFHLWYQQFMPSASAILRETVAALDDEVRLTTNRANNLTIQRLNYSFRIIAYDFITANKEGGPTTSIKDGDGGVKNFILMRRLMSHLPGREGHIQAASATLTDQLRRLDYQVSMAKQMGSTPVSEVYKVEAPGNSDWTTLWFTFSFDGGAATSADGRRIPFKPEEFVSPSTNVEAYLGFLRQRAMQGFLADLTKGYTFRTTPSGLP
jgi:hypothetical protein